jgi:hypothetical protein
MIGYIGNEVEWNNTAEKVAEKRRGRRRRREKGY